MVTISPGNEPMILRATVDLPEPVPPAIPIISGFCLCDIGILLVSKSVDATGAAAGVQWAGFSLSRLERWADRDMALQIHDVMFKQFISSFKEVPSELSLDFDATDDVIHGKQEGAYYHGYYENYCFLPLYVLL